MKGLFRKNVSSNLLKSLLQCASMLDLNLLERTVHSFLLRAYSTVPFLCRMSKSGHIRIPAVDSSVSMAPMHQQTRSVVVHSHSEWAPLYLNRSLKDCSLPQKLVGRLPRIVMKALFGSGF